jgi:hypothetical protein
VKKNSEKGSPSAIISDKLSNERVQHPIPYPGAWYLNDLIDPKREIHICGSLYWYVMWHPWPVEHGQFRQGAFTMWFRRDGPHFKSWFEPYASINESCLRKLKVPSRNTSRTVRLILRSITELAFLLNDGQPIGKRNRISNIYSRRHRRLRW